MQNKTKLNSLADAICKTKHKTQKQMGCENQIILRPIELHTALV